MIPDSFLHLKLRPAGRTTQRSRMMCYGWTDGNSLLQETNAAHAPVSIRAAEKIRFVFIANCF